MYQKKAVYRYGLCIIFLMINSLSLFSINNATLYFMTDLATRNHLNPSFQPKRGKVYVGFPLLSSLSLEYQITPPFIDYYAPVKIDKAIRQFSQYESLFTSISIPYLDFGVKHENYYFTFRVGFKGNMGMTLNSDLLKLSILGNGYFVDKDQPAYFQNTSEYHALYHEISFGCSRKFQDFITIGGNVKYLLGHSIGNIGLGNQSGLYTDKSTYQIDVKVIPEGYLAIPDNIYKLSEQKNVRLDSLLNSTNAFSAILKNDTTQVQEIFTAIGNIQGHGAALDLGFSLDLFSEKQLNLSFSVLNLGFISWTEGYVIQPHNQNPPQLTLAEPSLQEVKNFITQAPVDLKKQNKVIKLSGELYAGINYKIINIINAGFLFGLQGFGTTYYAPSYSFSINTQNLPVNLSLSYTIKKNRYDHLGIGILFGRDNFQFHVIVENVLRSQNVLLSNTVNNPTYLLYKLQGIGLRVGMNFLFGKQDRKQILYSK